MNINPKDIPEGSYYSCENASGTRIVFKSMDGATGCYTGMNPACFSDDMCSIVDKGGIIGKGGQCATNDPPLKTYETFGPGTYSCSK